MSAVKPLKPPARVAAAVAQSYRLDFEISASLDPSEDDPITSVMGKIVYLGSEDARAPEVIVGKLEGWYMRRDRLDNGYNFFEICDRYQDRHDVMSLVWDLDANDYYANLNLEGGGGDLIVPHAMSIVAEHRGSGIGLLAVWRFLDYFGGSAALAVVKPYPLNHNSSDKPPDEAFRQMYGQFAGVSKKSGVKALTRHWSKLGFRRLRDSEYLFLDMRNARPSLEDLIGGKA
jgi:hypothetical protein